MKRLLILGSVLCLFLVTGCVSNQQSAQKPEITVWHWMSDRHDAFLKLAQEYEKEHGVRVNFELFPHSAYSQKINAAAAAKDLPDLFGILGEKKLFASFIKEGLVENLTPYMQEDNSAWEKRFIDIALDYNSFVKGNIYNIPAGIYGVPIDFMSIQFVYNKKLLEQTGYNEPPQTWDEFIQLASEISKDNQSMDGFVCGWGENWYIYCLASAYAFDLMGEEKFFATMRGQVPYDDPDWIKVFSLFDQMRESKVVQPSIVTMNNKESEQAFATNRALFSFNGSWGVNTYEQINPALEYATMPPPVVNQEYSPKIWAGAGSSFMVDALSPNKDRAVQFLKWLTEKEQQLYLIKKTKNLPSVKGLEGQVSGPMAQFLSNKEYYTHPRLWEINEDSRVVEAINIGIQRIVIGEKTPQEVASSVQKIKQRNLEK